MYITVELVELMFLAAFEQALWGALTEGQEKEGELATTSLKFEYLHQKSQREMLIGGDDIINDVITLDTCFSMFIYICARFCFALIGRNLTAQSTRTHRGIGVEFKFQRRSCKLCFLFLPHRQSAPGRLLEANVLSLRASSLGGYGGPKITCL